MLLFVLNIISKDSIFLLTSTSPKGRTIDFLLNSLKFSFSSLFNVGDTKLF